MQIIWKRFLFVCLFEIVRNYIFVGVFDCAKFCEYLKKLNKKKLDSFELRKVDKILNTK